MSFKMRKLKILSINESEKFKSFILKKQRGTLGGIETNHDNIKKGLKSRGHCILENTPFPKDLKPDIIICPTYGPISLLSIFWYKRKYNCACVQHAHTTQEDIKGGFIPKPLIPYMNIYLRHLYKFSEILITPSNFSKNTLRKLGIPTRPPIIPVSNGVDLELFHYSDDKRAQFRAYLESEFGIDTNKRIILCVSVIWRRKGLNVFYAMAKKFPDIEFVWVGNYITAKKLKERFDDLPNLTFTGFVPDVIAAYCGADLFFFPSYMENQGIPLLEAAACRLPIVCRDLPTYDWIEHGTHCLKGNTNEEFAKRIKKLLDDDDLRKKLINNAYENVKSHDINLILDKVEMIYNRAIKLRKRLLKIQGKKH